MQKQETDTRQRLSTETRFSVTVTEGAGASAIDVPALTLLAHPDPRRVGELVILPALSSGQAVELSRRVPLFAAPGSSGSRPLAERYVSRKPLRLAPGGEANPILVERAGSPTPVSVDGEALVESRPIAAAELERGLVLELGRFVVLLLHLHPTLAPHQPRFGLIGDAGAMIRLRRDIGLAAGLDTPVLLRGASGTGKELVARAIHGASPRGARPWVTVNMAAIPPQLAAAELFGAKKGAYTGADRAKQGFFVAAEGGTLFLDEIGDTPSDVQPLLLRALESGEIQPVGGETRTVDVRVIAATDADLDNAITQGRFREPLLHRLSGWEVRLPPLAERRADIGRLLVHFLDRERRALGDEGLLDSARAQDRLWAPAPLVARLARHDWPGNVRQLRNVARRIAVMVHADPEAPLARSIEPLLSATSGPLSSQLVHEGSPAVAAEEPVSFERTPADASPTGRWRPVYRKASEVDEEELVATLRAHRWDLKPAAGALGVSRAVLYQLIDKHPRLRTAAQLERIEIEAALKLSNGEIAASAEDLEVSAQGLKLRMRALGLR